MAQKWPKITQNSPKMTQNCPNWPKNDPKLPKLAPAEKNSTDISAPSAAFCISDRVPCLVKMSYTSFFPPRAFIPLHTDPWCWNVTENCDAASLKLGEPHIAVRQIWQNSDENSPMWGKHPGKRNIRLLLMRWWKHLKVEAFSSCLQWRKIEACFEHRLFSLLSDIGKK